MITESKDFHRISPPIAEQAVIIRPTCKTGEGLSHRIDFISNTDQIGHALIGADSEET